MIPPKIWFGLTGHFKKCTRERFGKSTIKKCTWSFGSTFKKCTRELFGRLFKKCTRLFPFQDYAWSIIYQFHSFIQFNNLAKVIPFFYYNIIYVYIRSISPLIRSGWAGGSLHLWDNIRTYDGNKTAGGNKRRKIDANNTERMDGNHTEM